MSPGPTVRQFATFRQRSTSGVDRGRRQALSNGDRPAVLHLPMIAESRRGRRPSRCRVEQERPSLPMSAASSGRSSRPRPWPRLRACHERAAATEPATIPPAVDHLRMASVRRSQHPLLLQRASSSPAKLSLSGDPRRLADDSGGRGGDSISSLSSMRVARTLVGTSSAW